MASDGDLGMYGVFAGVEACVLAGEVGVSEGCGVKGEERRVVDFTPFSERKRFWLSVAFTGGFAVLMPLVSAIDPAGRGDLGRGYLLMVPFVLGGLWSAITYRLLKGRRVDRGSEEDWQGRVTEGGTK